MQAAASVLYFVYSEATLNMFIYWVLSMGMYIFFGGISDKIFEGAKAWFFKKSEERASYDNLIDMTGSIAGFAGYFLAMLYVPSLRMAIFFNFIPGPITYPPDSNPSKKLLNALTICISSIIR